MPRNVVYPLKKTELVQYFQVYRDAFPDWAVEHDVVLTRRQGPIRQYIAFEALRSGSYRPSCAVTPVLRIPDGCTFLHQFLDVKHESVSRRQHPIKAPLVLKAMEEQFIPPVREPLDVVEIVERCERDVHERNIQNMNHFAGLAALTAFLGRRDRAVYWCDQAEMRFANLGRQPGDWEVRKAQFAIDLRHAVESGNAREFLEPA
jgi:hypothetical protein